MTFFQRAPRLSNLYRQDLALQTELKRRLPADVLAKWQDALDKMGEAAAGELLEWLKEAEANPPRHVPYDAWGNRIDEIVTSPAWERYREFSSRQGLVALGYDEGLSEKARVLQAAMLYLFSASSATYSCPLAMTDAAARVLLTLAPASLRDRLVPKLLSKDPATFITSGQWMTERAGGSDVSNTETKARFLRRAGDEDRYLLSGTKWFTSATTAEMALTLARIEDSEGLTLFCVELKRETGKGIEGIEVNRLKDKLGTKALPTAELTLDGAVATRIGPIGRGIASISGMLTLTRHYNAVCSASSMAYSTALAKEYAKVRQAFGKSIGEHILHRQTLEELESMTAGAMAMTFEVAHLLGKVETQKATDEEAAVLRALVPIAKLVLGKQAVAHASETLECFGGAGYIEDTGLPRILRDAQVFPIWEGTTNVLSLDVLRAEVKHGALAVLLKHLGVRLERLRHVDAAGASLVTESLQRLTSMACSEESVRKLAFKTGLVVEAILLLEAAQEPATQDEGAPRRFAVFASLI